MSRLVNTEALIQYENSAFNVNARRALYDKYAAKTIGLLDPERPELGNRGMEMELIRSLQRLGYDGTGKLADIGCGDARFDERLLEAGHSGEVWPINYPSALFYPAQEELKDKSNVRFLETKAEDLRLENGEQLPDEYFDVVCLNHLLYHLQDYDAALAEAHRVLKPGGLLAISTKKDGNQGKLWSLAQNEIKEALEGISIVDALVQRGGRRLFDEINGLTDVIDRLEKLQEEDFTEWRSDLLDGLALDLGRKIAGQEQRYMASMQTDPSASTPILSGIVPPQSFYSHFDFEVENQVLPRHGFVHTGERFRQSGKLRVPGTDEGWLDVKMALYSFKDMYTFPFDMYPGAYVPIHASTMMRAIELGAKPVFDKEVARQKKPYFEDRVDMGFDIWQKPLTPETLAAA